jgi:hypothetical protein
MLSALVQWRERLAKQRVEQMEAAARARMSVERQKVCVVCVAWLEGLSPSSRVMTLRDQSSPSPAHSLYQHANADTRIMYRLRMIR